MTRRATDGRARRLQARGMPARLSSAPAKDAHKISPRKAGGGGEVVERMGGHSPEGLAP